MLVEDTWGIETGQKSSYEKAYAIRQGQLDSDHLIKETTSDGNLGNDFKIFESTQTRILRMQIQDMLVNLFTYENIPSTLNTSQLEIMLRQFGGGVCIGKDDQEDLVILGRADELGYNLYGNVIPSLFDGANNFLRDKKVITNRNLDGEYVCFYNKQSMMDFYCTDFEIVNHYAKLLATIKATERMNIMQKRSPYLFKGTKNGVNGQIMMQKIMSGELFMEVDTLADPNERMQQINLNSPDYTGQLQTAYRNTMNEMLTLFGIYNNPDMKKERLTAGESSANNHVIEAMGDIYFNARRHAVDLLNQAFGTEITVQWNSTVATLFRELGTNKNH